MTDLKTVLVDALNASQHPGYDPVKIFSERDEDHLIETGEYRLIDWIDGGEGRWAHDGDLVVQHDSLFDADRLAQAITDHFLDREKVKAILLSALDELDIGVDNHGFRLTDYYYDEDGNIFIGNSSQNDPEWGDGPIYDAFTTGLIPTEKFVDRLIEGLAGKVGE
nr:hypothetical protein [Brevundimonas naejangsanensis]